MPTQKWFRLVPRIKNDGQLPFNSPVQRWTIDDVPKMLVYVVGLLAQTPSFRDVASLNQVWGALRGTRSKAPTLRRWNYFGVEDRRGEARRAESGFLGMGQHRKLHQRGPGQSPGR